MAFFEKIDIDKFGYVHIVKTVETQDYQSDQDTFDFLGKNKKILLRLKSSHIGHAHNVGAEIYYNGNVDK